MHLRDGIDRTYETRKGGRGFASIEDWVEFERHINKSKDRMSTASGNSSTTKNKNKNNYMNTLSDKLRTLNMR